jgi:2-isopropylmalate synthase
MKGTDFSKQLRRKATDAERKLWGYLRGRRFSHHKFRRQVPMGPYIADFISFEGKLLVELDGNHHAAKADYDAKRDRWFEAEGFRVLRFSDRAALTETDRVLESIWIALHPEPKDTPTRPAREARGAPSPIEGEGKKRSEHVDSPLLL